MNPQEGKEKPNATIRKISNTKLIIEMTYGHEQNAEASLLANTPWVQSFSEKV